jgi:phage repressor protein C with HTH and peptisase S24 domain
MDMNDPSHELRRKNLGKIVKQSDMKSADFCRRYDLTQSYLSQMLSPGFRFGEKAARTFEKKLQLATGSLDINQDSGLFVIESWGSPDELPAGVYALVPRIALTLSATQEDANNKENTVPPLAFRADWLIKQNVSDKDNLRTCTVTGDAMEPYLMASDTILIDCGQSEIKDNDVYAIRYGQDIRIRRLARRFDGGLILRSDNTRYPEETLSAEDAKHIPVLGRMLWRGGAGV